ncbi:MAG: KEOPS complex subunit Pcc1 [Nitrososphaerales archaeon]
MESRVSLKIDFENEIAAEAVETALRPDNIDLPDGLDIRMKRMGHSLSIEINVVDNLPSLTGTLQEILQHCEVSARSIAQAK